MPLAVTEHIARTARHTTFYLASGDDAKPPIVFEHGWPELSLSWRHQLRTFASLGFRAIAPDLRGYGRSSVYPRHGDYALEHVVHDMLDLLDAIGQERAVWIGHDWGSPVVWSLASHHPERCHGVANLCVPHFPEGFTAASIAPLIDRTVYPESEFPAGQWDYQLFYQESFDRARAAFESNVRNTIKALFRKGSPATVGKPSPTARIRKAGGWFAGAGAAPDVPLDTDVLDEEALSQYVAALERNGFFGPDSYYMNHEANAEYAKRARNSGVLEVPVLFLHARYDQTCETVVSRLAEPMRQSCRRLTEVIVPSGHWMAQERPIEVNAAIACWLATALPSVWPTRPVHTPSA